MADRSSSASPGGMSGPTSFSSTSVRESSKKSLSEGSPSPSWLGWLLRQGLVVGDGEVRAEIPVLAAAGGRRDVREGVECWEGVASESGGVAASEGVASEGSTGSVGVLDFSFLAHTFPDAASHVSVVSAVSFVLGSVIGWVGSVESDELSELAAMSDSILSPELTASVALAVSEEPVAGV